ncbi:unnamed protein product [Phytophthora lilii]|uniref:Unnamed protein product n=1 Tax=Phytophthora lilii TaxID=2077276 RepID=A0A9W6TGI7_9STRA|nr:unnamed protein product [Phytophthora lilii]
MDSSATAKASKAFPALFILNGEALTLTRLLEEISVDDFGTTPSMPEDDDRVVDLNDDLDIGVIEDDDIGVKQFISESTRNIQGWFTLMVCVSVTASASV